MCPTQVTTCDLPIYNIFVPQKVTLLKISDDVISCDLWFAPPPNQKSCYAYGKRLCLSEPASAVPRNCCAKFYQTYVKNTHCIIFSITFELFIFFIVFLHKRVFEQLKLTQVSIKKLSQNFGTHTNSNILGLM